MGANYHYDVSTTGTPPQAEIFSLSMLYFSSNFNYFAITYLLPLICLGIAKFINYRTDEDEVVKKERLERVIELFH